MIDRLGRIDTLRSTGAEPREILVELRELVREGQRWAEAEGTSAARASEALAEVESSLGVTPSVPDRR